MADFLASFNLGAQTAAHSSNVQCGSVEDLQFRLRGVLDAKTSPTRAEHVSLSLELPASVQLTLNVSEPQNEALEGLANIDPSLGGVSSRSVPPESQGANAFRVVTAGETLMNQPANDPVLQKTVAKHIIGAVSAADESHWTVRQVARDSQGWTFTYVCKDSTQQWNRQNAKTSTQIVIGEYSQRDLDPILSTRPAFDCRGSITISFSRTSRSITVKYEHTPLHKTVAELTERFQPPERILGPGAVRQQKTPKKAESDKKERKRAAPKSKDDTGKTPRKKAAKRAATDGEDGTAKTPRKKKKRNNGDGQDAAPDGPIMPPDYPGAQAFNGPLQTGLPYSNMQDLSNASQAGQGFSDYPQGLMGDGSASYQAQPNGAGTPTSNNTSMPLNLAPAETARRREVATTLLSEAGVGPATLSTDQLNIFSNQSPELQKESLAMLVKYGAERLRIVHPTSRDSASPAAQGSSAGLSRNNVATPSGQTTTKELVPRDEAAGKKKGGGRKKSGAAAASTGQETVHNGSDTPAKSKRAPGKSRLSCYRCKARKVKCPKERRACAECEAEGHYCEYPPQTTRVKKKYDAVVIDDDEEEQDEEQDQTLQSPQEDLEQDPQGGIGGQNEMPDYSFYTQMPVADLLTPNSGHRDAGMELHAPQPSHFQSASGLAMPRSDLLRMSQQSLQNTPDLILPQGQAYGGTDTSSATAAATQQRESLYPQAMSPKQSKRNARQSQSGSRHSLPTETSNGGRQESPSMVAVAHSRHHSGAGAAAGSPLVPHQNFGNQPRVAKLPMATNSPQVHNEMQKISALSQAALQQSPVVAAAMQTQARTSPFQLAEAARAQSRQGMRALTRTPVTDSPVQKTVQPSATTNHRQRNENLPSGLNRADLGGEQVFNTTYGRFYEPYNQQESTTSSSSYPAYNSSRDTSSAVSMPGQTVTSLAMAPPAFSNSSESNQWLGSQSRDSRPHNSSVSYSSHDSFHQPSNSSHSSSSMQNFSMRQPAARTASSSLSQQEQAQQQPSYSSYTSHSQNQNQQAPSTNQQSNWYGVNNTPTTSNDRYNWKMQNQGWPGYS